MLRVFSASPEYVTHCKARARAGGGAAPQHGGRVCGWAGAHTVDSGLAAAAASPSASTLPTSPPPPPTRRPSWTSRLHLTPSCSLPPRSQRCVDERTRTTPLACAAPPCRACAPGWPAVGGHTHPLRCPPAPAPEGHHRAHAGPPSALGDARLLSCLPGQVWWWWWCAVVLFWWCWEWVYTSVCLRARSWRGKRQRAAGKRATTRRPPAPCCPTPPRPPPPPPPPPSRGPMLEPFVVTALTQLLCRMTKLGWLEDEAYRGLPDEARGLLEKGTTVREGGGGEGLRRGMCVGGWGVGGGVGEGVEGGVWVGGWVGGWGRARAGGVVPAPSQYVPRRGVPMQPPSLLILPPHSHPPTHHTTHPTPAGWRLPGPLPARPAPAQPAGGRGELAHPRALAHPAPQNGSTL